MAEDRTRKVEVAKWKGKRLDQSGLVNRQYGNGGGDGLVYYTVQCSAVEYNERKEKKQDE